MQNKRLIPNALYRASMCRMDASDISISAIRHRGAVFAVLNYLRGDAETCQPYQVWDDLTRVYGWMLVFSIINFTPAKILCACFLRKSLRFVFS